MIIYDDATKGNMATNISLAQDLEEEMHYLIWLKKQDGHDYGIIDKIYWYVKNPNEGKY